MSLRLTCSPPISPTIHRHTCGGYPWWEGVVRYMIHAESSPFPRRGSDPAFTAVCWCDFNSDLSERLTRVYALSIRVKPRNSHIALFFFSRLHRVWETRAIQNVIFFVMTSCIPVCGYSISLEPTDHMFRIETQLLGCTSSETGRREFLRLMSYDRYTVFSDTGR